MRARRTLIQGGQVLTMDDRLGTIPGGDVLIEGSRIAAIGAGLAADGAEIVDGRGRIVLPGLIDTHRHTWATMLRGSSSGETLEEYIRDAFFTYGAGFTPEDTWLSVRLGVAEAIDAGITTLHAWEDNLQTPEHADAAVSALRESGIRGRFSYGPSNDVEAGSSFARGTETIDLDDVLRLKRELDEDGAGLIELGIASRGPEYSQPQVWLEEFRFAREHGLPLTAHTLMTAEDAERIPAISIYRAMGGLGPDLLLVHAMHASDEDIHALAESETPVSLAPLAETRMGMGLPRIVELVQGGVLVGLSVDTTIASDSSDMFSVMRATAGIEAGHFAGARAVTAEQALRQATIDGARALGLGDVAGSLAPGKRADLILLRGHDLDVSGEQLVLAARPGNVEAVWVGGVVKKRDGELVGVDLPALVAAADDAVTALGRRIGRLAP